MIQSIEFTTKINQGMIVIPQEYYADLQEELEVEVIVRPKRKKRLIDRLTENPISAAGWRDLTREQLHNREEND